MFKLVSPDISHKEQWEEIMAEWGNTQKKPAIFFQDNYEKLLEGFQELSVSNGFYR
jgi:hypothetical protein